ncbi:YqcI/YcgG family protein [Streptomyces sp. 150FB]|uniref:YqcI/YcgG family protein n=1 Tax=Streptomyces sp. 150FB TaxID=1576605 RepID=UPI000AA8B993|nr:YqcI/YcgG family protein [Streptomyces sp. 150FB]
MVIKSVTSTPGPCTTETADAAALHAVREVVLRSNCPFAISAHTVAARPRREGEPLRDYFARSMDDVIAFSERAGKDSLDVLVYRMPAAEFGQDLTALGRLARTMVHTLMSADPRAPRPLDRPAVLRPDWRLSFAGVDYFMPVFAPLYPAEHSRHTFGVRDQVFLFLQPNESFHRRLGRRPRQVRQAIRHRFEAAGQPYDSGVLEAHKFVLPMNSGEPPIPWYDMAEQSTPARK